LVQTAKANQNNRKPT